MDLNVDREQEQLIRTARQFVERRFPLAEQAGVTNGDVDSRDALGQVAELGWSAMIVPDELGGAGGSLVDLALVAEELGRGGVVSPILGSQVVALTLAEAGGEHAELIGSIAEGTSIATSALLEPGPGSEWSERSTTGTAVDGGWSLHGSYSLVPYGHEADVVLLDADLEGRGRSLLLVRLPVAGATATRQRVIGSEPRAALRLDGVTVPTADVLPVATDDVQGVLDLLLDRNAVLQSAHAVGACEGALQLSVQYAKDREQFGRVIGSFQTIANRCADMRLGIDAARLLTWEAAWSVETGHAQAAERVSVAKTYLNGVGDTVTVNSHQVHGAIGYSTEYPLHIFTRHVKAYQTSYGTNAIHLERIAQAIGL
ncbi:MAG: acyl-CoA dehydrogenase family protein [Aeromicrobium sp.]